jgi:hypothetical protein
LRRDGVAYICWSAEPWAIGPYVSNGPKRFRGSVVSPRGTRLPVPAPFRFRGSAPLPPRGEFGLHPRPVRVGSPRGSAPTREIAILTHARAHAEGASRPASPYHRTATSRPAGVVRPRAPRGTTAVRQLVQRKPCVDYKGRSSLPRHAKRPATGPSHRRRH